MKQLIIKLGDRVKDSISGFKGIAYGRTDWLNGCSRIGIAPEKLTKEGKQIDIEWFDINQVKVVKTKQALAQKKERGGPMNDPRF